MGGPTGFRRPSVPGVPRRRRAFERAGREITPLAGPDIPISDPQEEQFEARYQSWRQVYNGSKPEFIVFEWLVTRKKLVEGVEFVFQHSLLGGRTRFGGFIMDFYFPTKNVVWRVNGERFHLDKPESRARDAIAAAIMVGKGLKLVDLWEDDILSRPEFVLNLAFDRDASVPGRRFIF